MIASLEKSSAKNPEDQLRIAQELETLKNKRDFLMRNPIVLASDKKSSPSGKSCDYFAQFKVLRLYIPYSHITSLKYHAIAAAHAVNLPFNFVAARLLDLSDTSYPNMTF